MKIGYERNCLECGIDISGAHGALKRCNDCRTIRRRMLDRERKDRADMRAFEALKPKPWPATYIKWRAKRLAEMGRTEP